MFNLLIKHTYESKNNFLDLLKRNNILKSAYGPRFFYIPLTSLNAEGNSNEDNKLYQVIYEANRKTFL